MHPSDLSPHLIIQLQQSFSNFFALAPFFDPAIHIIVSFIPVRFPMLNNPIHFSVCSNDARPFGEVNTETELWDC